MVLTRLRSLGGDRQGSPGGRPLSPDSERLAQQLARQQAMQLHTDRANIQKYRASWQGQERPHVAKSALQHVRDVLWWLEHVCGVNMLDYEEKVLVCLLFGCVLGLIVLGAYKQGEHLAALAGHLRRRLGSG